MSAIPENHRNPTRSPWLRRSLLFCACTIVLLSLFPGLAAADETDIQAQQTKIRAAYLYHFLQLVKWPSEDSGASETAFSICIIGKDPFGDILEVVAKKKARGRDIVIRRLTDSHQLERCHILYISLALNAQVSEILKAADTQNVLTVSSSKDFAAKGGMIEFMTVADDSEGGSRVRFEINLAAARKQGFKINSKLLELATHVRQ